MPEPVTVTDSRVLITTGAIKNVGDFLIHDRARHLLARALPTAELPTIPRWRTADPSLIASSAGLIACGGPGLGPGLTSSTYVPLGQAMAAGRPVSILGAGWSGHDQVGMDAESTQTVQEIRRRGGVITVRDPLTGQRLETSTGVEAILTGCPAWYHLPQVGDPLSEVSAVRSIVFTPPASVRHLSEAVQAMRLLARIFPSAQRFCVLHRGFPQVAVPRPSRGSLKSFASSIRQRSNYVKVSAECRKGDWQLIDASSDLRKIDFYDGIDLHVGYRVHAHIDTLSLRRPSILIAEDVRGLGQFEALEDSYRLCAGDSELLDKLENAIQNEVADFTTSRAAVASMNAHWPVMQSALEEIASTLNLP